MKKFLIFFFFTLIIKAQADNKIIYGTFDSILTGICKETYG